MLKRTPYPPNEPVAGYVYNGTTVVGCYYGLGSDRHVEWWTTVEEARSIYPYLDKWEKQQIRNCTTVSFRS